jgi:hypothetical protein
MKVYGTVNENNSSIDGNEAAPLLSKSRDAQRGGGGSNFKRLAGVATLLASGAAFAIASSGYSISNAGRASSGTTTMRVGDALDDAKAGACSLRFFRSMRREPRFGWCGSTPSPHRFVSFLFNDDARRKKVPH